MSVLIGISGKACSGKDTVAKAIIAAYSDKYDIRKYAFADSLKEEIKGREVELCLRYGIRVLYNEDGTLAEKQSPLLQYWGTDFRRGQDPHYWVKKLAYKLDLENPQIALISDVRFRSEAAWIIDRGGYIIRVERANYVDLSRSAIHISEVDMDLFTDWFVKVTCGDGEVEQLKKDAKLAFEMVLQDLDLVGYTLKNFNDVPIIEK
jgi:hypothetical protein